MGDSWLSDAGLRVTDFEKSIEFYNEILDLEELKRVAGPDSAYVLFRDRRSGHRLELNWYAEASPFWTPFTRGEGLDHLEVRVRNLPEFLERLRRKGIFPVTRQLWVNAPVVAALKSDPEMAKEMDQDVWVASTEGRIRFRADYIPDPDENLICVYDHPEEAWEGPIPDHY